MSSRILVVDDEPSARLTTAAQLEPERWEIHFEASGAGAIRRLGEPAMDLVICDLMMPGVDGFAVCRALRASHTWRQTPMILLTATGDTAALVQGLEAGADEFVTKPVEGNVLRARVRALLRLRASYLTPDAVPDRAEIIARAQLTEREREVLDLLLLGRTHDDIAIALGISARTSRFHQSNLLSKLGAESRLDLMRVLL